MNDSVPEQKSLEKVSRQAEVPATVTVPSYTIDLTEESAPSLLDYWRVVRKRHWTIWGILLLVVATVMIGTLKQKPVYRAKAVLQIDRENPNILTFKDFVADINPYDDTYLETAYKVFQSRTLARRVIDKLHLDQVPEFQEETAQDGQEASWWDHIRIWQASWEKLAPGEGELDPNYRHLLDRFLARLTVSPVRRSRLVEISFDSYDPALSARVVNTLAANFIDLNLEAKWEATEKASDWLSQQLVGLKGRLEKSEEDLQRYAKQHSILFLDEKQSMSTEKLKQLQEEATRAEGDRIQKESLYSQVRSGDLSSIPGMVENKLYQDLMIRLADLRREYSDLSATFTANYPRVKRLRSQIEETEAILEKERAAFARRVGDDYRAAVNRSRLLQQAVAQQTREFNEIAEKSIQYSILKREVDTNKQLYEGLLQRLKEAGISAGLRASNIRVVDEAEVPLQPAKPRPLINLALALLVGLGLGVGMAFFQEYLDDTLKSPDDVQRFLRVPALGVIPATSPNGRGQLPYGYGYGSRKSLPTAVSSEGNAKDFHSSLVALNGTTPQAEAYRSLRTSVLLSTSGRPPRVILVTSAQPGEGKTTTVVNLAITLTQLGGRVLVVDSDMRRPRIHTLLKLPSTAEGLSTYLTGQCPLEQVAIATNIPNLHAILCGPIPPNPAELISSELMRKLLSQAPQQFDYILLDSPPVLHVSDARILAAQVEAVILVAHGAVTPREAVKHAKQHLAQVNANVIGVALNNVDLATVGYDYYYRHYRRYGYGYGGTDSQDMQGG